MSNKETSWPQATRFLETCSGMWLEGGWWKQHIVHRSIVCGCLLLNSTNSQVFYGHLWMVLVQRENILGWQL